MAEYDWRAPYPPVVGQFRSDQVADQANWKVIGLGPEYAVDHGIGAIQRQQGTDITVVNPLDPVSSSLLDVPPGNARVHGLTPIPAGRH